jgi:BTB/POZ domain
VFCADAPIKVIVGSEKLTFHAHKAVLFKSAVLESKYESEEGTSEGAAIILPDEDPVHFRKILHYLYYGPGVALGRGNLTSAKRTTIIALAFCPGTSWRSTFELQDTSLPS